MRECNVTLTATAGILIEYRGKKVLIDALHDRKEHVFSVVSPEVIDTVMNSEKFAEPDVIIVTHDHPDHYSRELIARELEKYPNAVLFAPFDDFPEQEELIGSRIVTEVAGIKLDFKKLTHEGAEFRDVDNYACLIDFGDFTVLNLGDTQTGDAEVEPWIGGREIDLAVLAFPWYGLTKGRRVVDNDICPHNILLVHLPFEADDQYGYREFVDTAFRKNPPSVYMRAMTEPLQRESFS